MPQTWEDIYGPYREYPTGWFEDALGIPKQNIWKGMQDVCDSVVKNEYTAVPAGHGVSKSYSAARLALWYLYTHWPSSVITTAPIYDQVEGILWREIREAHASSKWKLLGQPTSLELDLQPVLGIKWFAIGVAVRPDTVTREATRLQGYHNDNMLVIMDEAAGILPEIHRAAKHIGGSLQTRRLMIGNSTSEKGEFAEAVAPGSHWNVVRLSVLDTPNYIAGRTIIPGVYGREYVDQIIRDYGRDSDEFRVRVEGYTSKKAPKGAYYGDALALLHENRRIGDVPILSGVPVNVVFDPGYTTAIWLWQMDEANINVLKFYEDSGPGAEDYATLLHEWRRQYKWEYGTCYLPWDAGSKSTAMTSGKTWLATLRDMGFHVNRMKQERDVNERIARTKKMIPRCRFNFKECGTGLGKLRGYCEKVNKSMSTETALVFTGAPEKNGCEHASDSFGYLSLAIQKLGNRMTVEEVRALQEQYA